MQQSGRPQGEVLQHGLDGRLGGWLIASVALLCSLGVAFASWRHTGSLAFPIDDGYIYSNYVSAAAQGHLFTYNLGEQSGGITGAGWYLLCLVAYLLLSPFHAVLGGLAPTVVQAQPGLAAQAGHLYLSAYLPGVACLALTGIGVQRIAKLALPPAQHPGPLHSIYCWLLGAVAAADLGLVWGAMSGLESALSAALVTWAVVALLQETRRGELRWSLLFAALLPWARPDLLVVGVVGLGWLLFRAFRAPSGAPKSASLRLAATYAAALGLGLALLALFFSIGWGRPLPSSFYAKVGGLRTGERFFSAVEELRLAGRAFPFIVALLALGGGVAGILSGGRSQARDVEGRERKLAVALLLSVAVAYVAAIMATLPWFGQEDRYLLPIHPLVITLVGLLGWMPLRLLGKAERARSAWAFGAFIAAFVALLPITNYWWATRNYSVQVRNINDGHVLPARWLADNSPVGSVVAAEPIGAVKLFGERPTIDLVGLTTPATLGTYGDWDKAWPALRNANARYLLYYPAWFDRQTPPSFAGERARFSISDNKIAGDSVIVIYELLWDRSATH